MAYQSASANARKRAWLSFIDRQHMQNPKLRTTLAIGSGVLVWLIVGLATGDAWGRYSGIRSPDAVLFARFLGFVVSGYVAASVAGRAHMAHALGLCGIIIGFAVLRRFVQLHHGTEPQSWPNWACGAVPGMVWIIGGALFRYWQITRRSVQAYPSSGANAASPRRSL
jgi:hypothetical protein